MKGFYDMESLQPLSQYKTNTHKGTPPIRILSLFSGCGGLDLGFTGGFDFLGQHYERFNTEIVFADDILKPACTCYEYNFKHSICSKSICDLNYDDLPNTQVDLIIGSCPCQPFSYAGKRKGLNDPRGMLYLDLIRIIRHYRPYMFVSENVDGIRNSRTGDKDKIDDFALNRVIQAFNEAGYNTTYKVLLASDYGVPQMRRRVFIIGIRKDIGTIDDIKYPSPTHSKYGDDGHYEWITAYDAIDDLWNKLGQTAIPNHTVRDVSKAKFYEGKKMQGNNAINPNTPSPTIRAEHHGNIEAHYRNVNGEIGMQDMSKWRRLSVRECARLQSFPDDYDFCVSASSAYKVIGNAVPPVLAWHIAKEVLDKIEKIKERGL